MNRKYGKLMDGKLEYAPSSLHTDHGLSFNPSADDYKSAGYKPIVSVCPESREEFYWVESGLEETDAAIVRTWEERKVEPMPKTYNKYRLGMAIQSAGRLDALLQFFAANPAAKFHWDNAQDFADNDENFKAIVAVFVEQFDEEAVTEILKAAEV